MDLEDIDYRKMMGNQKIVCSREVSDLYNERNRQYRYLINRKEEYRDNLLYIACKLREEFRQFGYSEETIADMLVEYLYGKEKDTSSCSGFAMANTLSAIWKKHRPSENQMDPMLRLRRMDRDRHKG